MSEASPYSNRELDHYFSDFKSDIRDIKDTLGRVEGQTSKTNGRVNKLEWWQKAVVWGLGAAWSVILLVVPIFVWVGNKLMDQRDTKLMEQTRAMVIEEIGKAEFTVTITE